MGVGVVTGGDYNDTTNYSGCRDYELPPCDHIADQASVTSHKPTNKMGEVSQIT